MIVGITGATGIVYGVRLLRALRLADIESHLIVTKPGEQTRAHETELSAKDLKALADVSYGIDDIAAAIASGSFRTMGMIVAPCSVRTLAEIATGTSSNLLTRAADVTLKERRRLVLMVRETPLSAIHLDNMARVTAAGGIIFPPVPAFYTRPQTLDDIVDHTIGRALDLFDIDVGLVQRWTEPAPPA
jgi:4-hydroxy-3-polyprenylbenzoate decarboxylase